jgi:SulP family sulfate permease
MSFDVRIARLHRFVPIIGVLRSYRRRDLSQDVVAGLIVGCITIPQAVAYAFLAGLPATAGLYACLLPMVVYAVLGSSRELVVGPVAVAAIMVAEAIRTHVALYPGAELAIAAVLSIESGLVLMALRATQMGGIVNLLSHPVVVGFVNAAAIIIILSQLAPFFGLESRAGSPITELVWFAEHLGELNFVTTAIGLGSLVLLWLTRRYGYLLVVRLLRRVTRQHAITRTGPLVVTLLSIVIVALFALDLNHGVSVVGPIPSGLPPAAWPSQSVAFWLDLLPNAAMIALVAYVESYSIGTALAGRKQRRIDAHQELVALGAANIAGGLTGAYPVAGSFSRSGVNVAAGARTPVSSLVCAGVVLFTLLWLTGPFERLPHAALAAIIVVSVVDLIDFKPMLRDWKFYPYDAYAQIVTVLGVLLMGAEAGLIAGMLVSIALFVRSSAKPQVAILGRVGESSHFRNSKNHPVTTYPGVLAVRVDENLYFANANNVENKLLKIVARHPDTRDLLLVCSAINLIDSSGLELLLRLNRKLERDGIRLHLCEVKVPVMKQLSAAHLPEALTGRIFFTTDEGVRRLLASAPETVPETGVEEA